VVIAVGVGAAAAGGAEADPAAAELAPEKVTDALVAAAAVSGESESRCNAELNRTASLIRTAASIPA
jgi:hypothetical protein